MLPLLLLLILGPATSGQSRLLLRAQSDSHVFALARRVTVRLLLPRGPQHATAHRVLSFVIALAALSEEYSTRSSRRTIFPDLGEYPLAIVLACLATGALRGSEARLSNDSGLLAGRSAFCRALSCIARLRSQTHRTLCGALAAFAAYGREPFGLPGKHRQSLFVVSALVIHHRLDNAILRMTTQLL